MISSEYGLALCSVQSRKLFVTDALAYTWRVGCGDGRGLDEPDGQTKKDRPENTLTNML